MKNIDNNLSRFRNLWHNLMLSGMLSDDKDLDLIVSVLKSKYQSPTYCNYPTTPASVISKRSYHTLDHIDFGLTVLDEVRSSKFLPTLSSRDFEFIEMAWWYHDETYLTDSSLEKGYNERTSGISCFRDMTVGGMSGQDAARLYTMIVATTHAPIISKSFEDKLEQKLICDIDLASLGLPYDEFLSRAKAVREEYTQYSDEQFYKGHAAVLKQFSDRPQIFYIPYFVDKYEKQARENIDRWIKSVI